MRRGSPALSVPQFRTLAFLGRQAGASLSALAHHLGVTPPTVSALVDRLVREGLVDRAVDPFERRRSVLTLTAAGLDFLRAAHENTRQRVEEALDRLTTEELEAVTRAMSLLGTVFGEVTKRG